MGDMRTPIFVRPLTDAERESLRTGLHSSDAFVLRRCQILLASSRGERAPRIADALGCNDQTVRNAVKAFNDGGEKALTEGSRAPKTTRRVFDGELKAEELKALLHQSPRKFGQETSVWTLQLVADVSLEQGLIGERVTDETIRNVLKRLGVNWKRAKKWITSPDPEYARKKAVATG